MSNYQISWNVTYNINSSFPLNSGINGLYGINPGQGNFINPGLNFPVNNWGTSPYQNPYQGINQNAIAMMLASTIISQFLSLVQNLMQPPELFNGGYGQLPWNPNDPLGQTFPGGNSDFYDPGTWSPNGLGRRLRDIEPTPEPDYPIPPPRRRLPINDDPDIEPRGNYRERKGSLSTGNAGQKLAAAGESVANSLKSKGYCYRGVKKAVKEALGVNLTGGSAYMAADQLASSSKFTEVTGQFPNGDSLENLPPGAIVVWDKNNKHPYGHISIASGNGTEYSDHPQSQAKHISQKFRVFIPNSSA
jgi:hypothetical protein